MGALFALVVTAIALVPIAVGSGVRYLGDALCDLGVRLMLLSVRYLDDEQRAAYARGLSPAARRLMRIRDARDVSLTHRG